MKPQTRLKLITGGKGEPPSGGVNWLNALVKGTAFSCKKKGNITSADLDVFIIAFKYDRTIVLVDAFETNRRFAVDPEDFCKRYSWWETVGNEEQDSSPKVNEEAEILPGVEDDIRPVQSSILEDDVDA